MPEARQRTPEAPQPGAGSKTAHAGSAAARAGSKTAHAGSAAARAAGAAVRAGNAGNARTEAAPLLFMIADTGGGHRSAARAVGQALELAYPGRFAPVLCDPLGGPGSARLLRWVTGLYGPAIRLAPWLWGAAYHASNSGPAMRLFWRAMLRPAGRLAADTAAAHDPAAIVSFHPLTGMAAAWARDHGAPGTPVVTVVTDLATMHAAWRCADVDLVIGPAGPPVSSDLSGGPLRPDERATLRQALGLPASGLVVLVTGGGEGGGGIARRAAAILRRFADVAVVAVCGRNLRVQRRLDRLAARAGGRLTVTGFARNMADWLRCCDLVVTKAGPGTIAEATCCGAPMLLTSHVPGQEKGNAEFVASAGAGRHVRSVGSLIAEISRLRDDSAALDAMRVASARLGRPGAATGIAEMLVDLIRAGRSGAGPGIAAPSQPGTPGGCEPVELHIQRVLTR